MPRGKKKVQESQGHDPKRNAGKAITAGPGYEPVVHEEEREVAVEQTPGIVEALGVIADKLAALVAAVQEQTAAVRAGLTVKDGKVYAGLPEVMERRPVRAERADPPAPTPEALKQREANAALDRAIAKPDPKPEPAPAAPSDPWGEANPDNLKRLALAAVADQGGAAPVQEALKSAGLPLRISELKPEHYQKAKEVLLPLVKK